MVRAPGVLNEAYDYFPKPSSFSRGLCFDINGFKILLISCTASVDENGKTIHVGDFRAQCWRTYRNITEILEAEKMTWYDIVRTTCYLRDIERDYNDFNEEVGLCNKPVLLKRGMSATIKEFLFAAPSIFSNRVINKSSSANEVFVLSRLLLEILWI